MNQKYLTYNVGLYSTSLVQHFRLYTVFCVCNYKIQIELIITNIKRAKYIFI